MIFLAVLYREEINLSSIEKNWGASSFFANESLGVLCFALSAGYFSGSYIIVCLLFFSPVIVSTSLLLGPSIGKLINKWPS